MNALFIVPCLVSPNVNPKLVPALCKLIERNILLTNSAAFEKAALERYKDRPFSTRDSRLKKFGKTVGRTIGGIITHPLAKSNTINENTELFYLSNFNLNENTILEAIGKSANANQKRKMKYQKNLNSGSGGSKPPVNIKTTTGSSGSNPSKKPSSSPTSSPGSSPGSGVSVTINNPSSPTSHSGGKPQPTGKVGQGSTTVDFDHAKRSHHGKLEDTESPTEVKFFQQISIEPTYLEIPITWTDKGNHEVSTTNVIRVGVKAIAYTIDSSISIVGLLKESKNMATLELLFKKIFRSVIRNLGIKFFGGNVGTKGFKINSGEADPNEAVNMIKYGPTARDLTRPAQIGKLFNTTESSKWSTMIVLSSYDFQDTNTDINEIINNYRRIVDYVVGDLVITNETQESVYFCTIKTKSCQEIGFDYLQKVLNLAGVIDYSLVKKRPGTVFSKVNMMKAFKEHIDYESMIFDIKNKIENIIN